MTHDRYDDEALAAILRNTETIALVGASPNPARPSFSVMRFLLSRGYRVLPVNPGQAGKEIQGQKVYGRLADIGEETAVDMIDVFRASEYLGEVVEEALAMTRRPKVIWSQLGVRDDRAAARAEAEGLRVVMNRCPAIEIPRLLV